MAIFKINVQRKFKWDNSQQVRYYTPIKSDLPGGHFSQLTAAEVEKAHPEKYHIVESAMAESIMRESEAYSRNRQDQMSDAYQHTLRQRRFDGNIVNGLGTFKRGNIIVTIGRDGRWKCGPDSGKDKATLESCLDLKYPVTPLPQESVQEDRLRAESVQARLRRAFENILPPEEAALAARGPMQNGTEIDVQLRGAALTSRLENLDLFEPQR